MGKKSQMPPIPLASAPWAEHGRLPALVPQQAGEGPWGTPHGCHYGTTPGLPGAAGMGEEEAAGRTPRRQGQAGGRLAKKEGAHQHQLEAP